MQNLKSVLVLSAACILALPGCPKEDEPATKTEICTNTVDDDGDSKIDCADSDCASATNCQKQEICDNTLDDDADGQFDCDDPDCDAAANCQSTCATGTTPCGTDCCTAGETCSNGTCVTSGCATGTTACGSNCCTAGQVCNNGNCETQVTCNAATETLCGNDCCTNGSETCVDNVCVGSNPEGCLVPATYGQITVTGEAQAGQTQSGANVIQMYGALPANDTTTDMMAFEMWEGSGVFANGFQTGDITLGTGDDANYATCGLCVLLYADVASDGTPAAAYFATGGTVRLDSYEGTLTATLTNGTFVHVDINQQTAQSTPSADGCASAIAKANINGTFPVAEICDDAAAADEDGDGAANCDDSDCASNAACVGAECDPLAPTCATGEGCYYVENTGFFCATAGTIAIGQPCTAFGSCEAGAECLDDACRAWCSPTANPSTCAVGEACESVTQDGSLGLCYVAEICDDAANADEDGDGAANCLDSDCSSLPACLAALCQSAVAAPGATFATTDSTNGTQGAQGSCGGRGKEVIYTVTAGTAGETGQLTIAVTSPFDAVIHARTTCDTVSTEVGCIDDAVGSATSPATESLVIDNFAGGSTVTLFVDAYGSGVGISNVTVSFIVPVCGNGVVEPGETCDDSSAATPGCDATCHVESGYACVTTGGACHAITCGDGIIDAPENCDDSNTTPNDGCSATCTVELAETEPANNAFGGADIYGTSAFAAQITAGDEDWVKVTLTALSSLTAETLDMGDGACAANDLDSKLELYRADGVTKIASSDDEGVGYCSLITQGRLAAGDYYLRVIGYNATAAFQYRLQVNIAAPEACQVPADYTTVTPATSAVQGGADQSGNAYVVGNFGLNADPDTLKIELYQGSGVFAAGLAAGTYTIAGDELNYRTCGLCVRIKDNASPANYYMATGGTVNLTSVSGNLTGTLSNATFEQVTIASDYTSTPVVGGCPSAITSVAFDGAITTAK